MPTPHQALPFPVNPLAAALECLPEEVSDVVELRHLHAPVGFFGENAKFRAVVR